MFSLNQFVCQLVHWFVLVCEERHGIEEWDGIVLEAGWVPWRSRFHWDGYGRGSVLFHNPQTRHEFLTKALGLRPLIPFASLLGVNYVINVIAVIISDYVFVRYFVRFFISHDESYLSVVNFADAALGKVSSSSTDNTRKCTACPMGQSISITIPFVKMTR